jgi:hypothetical protein
MVVEVVLKRRDLKLRTPTNMLRFPIADTQLRTPINSF